MFLVLSNVQVQILRSGADKHGAHNLLKPSMCKLDQGEGYHSNARESYCDRDETVSL